MTDQIIYVALLNEGVPVWKPIRAEHIGEARYRIVEQNYNRDIERWEFQPGDEVECEPVKTEDGMIVAAKRLASGP